MESIEVTAATLDAATEQAAKELGVKVSDLKVTVLEQSKGLFGKGTVKIKAESSASGKPAKATRGKKAAAKEEAPAPEPEEVVEEKPAAKPARGRKAAPAKEAAASAEPATEEAPEERPEVVATDADAKKILKLLSGILDGADLRVTLSVKGVTGRYVNLEVDGPDTGHLVGKHGEVLNALQYLANIITAQQLQNGVRVTVDGGNYRQRREASLIQLAERIATEVRKRNEEALLDALPAFERRIIHKALSTMEGIVTYSEGEEPNRRVVIAPGE
ncbi:MAG: KH domain-containing protein [Fimbriimonadaceae bacterium]|nr:KH domain-containing protein [Fimbriimonadaceae bacterium]